MAKLHYSNASFIRISLILFSCFMCFNIDSFAQQSLDNLNINKKPAFYLGGFLDLNINMHSANFTKLSDSLATCCPDYKSANGLGFSIGGLFEMPISDEHNLFFGRRLGYASIGADFAEKEKIGNAEIRHTTPPYETDYITDANTTYHLESALSIINLNPYISYNIWNRLFISGGLNIGYLISNSMDMREELTDPDNVTFTNGSRIRNEYKNQTIPNTNALQFGLSAGLSYQLPIGTNSYLVPEVRYNYALTDISDVNWKANYLQLGVGIKFPFYSENKIKENVRYERDTVIEKRFDVEEPYIELVESNTYKNEMNSVIVEKYKLYKPAKAKLAANFKAFGVSNGQRQFNPTVIIEEFATTESFPILPIVYFPDGNADLTNTRMKLLTNLATKNFSEESIKVDMLDVYYNLLNLIGKRLRENPNMKVTIAGYSSGEGKDKANPNIWQERATSVKNYLVNIWNISEEQLSTEQRQIPQRNISPKSMADAVEENSKVELIPNDFKLFKPVQLSEVERIANPPQIEFETTIESEAGVDNYVLEILQDNNEIRRFVGRAEKENIIWKIDEMPVPVLETPVRATFKAKDRIGQTKEVVQEIKIEQETIKKKRDRIEGDMKVERYSLVLFEYDKAEVSQSDKYLLQDAGINIQPNSKVMISGFADRTGESQYNKNLAKRRCEEVKKAIQIPNPSNVKVDAIGNDKSIFNNSLPEGRALSRTVRIEVRTPIK